GLKDLKFSRFIASSILGAASVFASVSRENDKPTNHTQADTVLQMARLTAPGCHTDVPAKHRISITIGKCAAYTLYEQPDITLAIRWYKGEISDRAGWTLTRQTRHR